MSEKKRKTLRWINKHKKELCAAGVCISTLILLVLCYKHQNSIKALLKSLQKIVNKRSAHTSLTLPDGRVEINPAQMDELSDAVMSELETRLIEVGLHPRRLPKGQHASQMKILEAEKLGIDLMGEYTIVDPYKKRKAAA